MIVNVSVPWIRHGFLPTPPFSGEACRFCAFGMMMMHLGRKEREVVFVSKKCRGYGSSQVLRSLFNHPFAILVVIFSDLKISNQPAPNNLLYELCLIQHDFNWPFKSPIHPKTKVLNLRSCLISQGDGNPLFWKKSSLLWKPPQRDVRFYSIHGGVFPQKVIALSLKKKPLDLLWFSWPKVFTMDRIRKQVEHLCSTLPCTDTVQQGKSITYPETGYQRTNTI